MRTTDLPPHEVDRALVAAGIQINRALRELRNVDMDLVPPLRRARFEGLMLMLDIADRLTIFFLRTGRHRGKVPTTLDEVADIDRYREEFIEPAEKLDI